MQHGFLSAVQRFFRELHQLTRRDVVLLRTHERVHSSYEESLRVISSGRRDILIESTYWPLRRPPGRQLLHKTCHALHPEGEPYPARDAEWYLESSRGSHEGRRDEPCYGRADRLGARLKDVISLREDEHAQVVQVS
jgi:hypothetical protein